MIKSLISLALIICITPLGHVVHADTFNGIKAMGVCTAFGVILPAALGVGSYSLEEHLGITGPPAWRQENHFKIESTKLLQTLALSAISALTWTITRGFAENDICAALVMMSIYSYGQGRALYRRTESKLLKATSYCLPTAVVMMASTRIVDLSPHLDLAVKPILVFVLAHICGA